jgi:hypothetical protein
MEICEINPEKLLLDELIEYRKLICLKLAKETDPIKKEHTTRHLEEIDHQIKVKNKKRNICPEQQAELKYLEALIIQLNIDVLNFETGGSTPEVFKSNVKETLKKIEGWISEIELRN